MEQKDKQCLTKHYTTKLMNSHRNRWCPKYSGKVSSSYFTGYTRRVTLENPVISYKSGKKRKKKRTG